MDNRGHRSRRLASNLNRRSLRTALLVLLSLILVGVEVLSVSAYQASPTSTSRPGYPPPEITNTVPGYPPPGATVTVTVTPIGVTPSPSASLPATQTTGTIIPPSPTRVFTGTVGGPLVPLGTVTMIFPTPKATLRPKVGGRIVLPEEKGIIQPWLQTLARIALVIVVGFLWIMLGGWIVILIRWARL